MIKSWLNKPYFFIKSLKFNIILSIIIGGFIFAFLSIFKPFGMFSNSNDPILYPLGFGIITTFVMILAFIYIPFLFKKTFSLEYWTVGKNIIFIISMLLTIAVVNWFYNINVQNVTKKAPIISFLEMISFTFSLSFFPTFIYMYLSEKYFREKRVKTSESLMTERISTKKIKTKKEVIVFGNNKDEKISFILDDLIYISSQGNYASFFINTNNEIKERILRNTLNNIIDGLNSHKNLIRCHKSYIINTNYIESISGNARGYYLISSLISKEIPVSRKYNKEELKKLIN